MSPAPARKTDVIVIGAGPAGEEISLDLRARGREVVVIERELVGGECAYWACMPSKALLRPRALQAEVERYRGVAGARIDVGETLRKRDEANEGLDDSDKAEALSEAGIELVRGEARLIGERRVEVAGETIEASEAVVVATGTKAMVPDAFRAAEPWTNREITLAEEPPKSLVVVGGGYIGCEMACAWRSLGTEVTMIAGPGGVLEREADFAAELVKAQLEADGVEVESGEAAGAEREGEEVVVAFEDGRELRAAQLLVAVGREPRSDGLGLEDGWLDDAGFVETDEQLRVGGNGWLYAVGDVNGRALLTHEATLQARFAARIIAGESVSVPDHPGGPPHVIFTTPQIASVGHTPDTAAEEGLAFREIDADPGMTAAATFIGGSERTGGQFVVTDEEDPRILGATFCGPEVADLLYAANLAVVAGLRLSQICETAPTFPTRSEVWLQAVPEASD